MGYPSTPRHFATTLRQEEDLSVEHSGCKPLHGYQCSARRYSQSFERCLEKEPDKRYQSFREIREISSHCCGRRGFGKVIESPMVGELTATQWGLKGGQPCRPRSATRKQSPASTGRLPWNHWMQRSRNAKGGSLDALGCREEAIACFDRALDLNRQFAAPWHNKGDSLFDLGRHTEALVCYEQAVALDPQDAAAWNRKGLGLSQLTRRQEAIACFVGALALDPQNTHVWYNKGLCLAALDNREEASPVTITWPSTISSSKPGSARGSSSPSWGAA